MKYKVKLIFKYSDIVHVEAESEDEAEDIAMKSCDEQFESYWDCEITEDDELGE